MSSEEMCVKSDVVTQIESIKLTENQESMDEARGEANNHISTSQLNMEEDDCTTESTASNSALDTSDSKDNNDVGKDLGKFYEDAKKYWSNIPPTVDGMLGGFGEISNIDLKGSYAFLNTLFKLKPTPNKRYALDCGAGIGRVTKGLLLPIFEKVDIVEQDPIFSEKAREYIGMNDRIGKIYNVGLQEFIPEPQKYDIVWCQWVLGHLTDDDLLKFFQRVKLSLCKNGVFIIKENVSSSNSLELDDTDSSMTRPLRTYQEIIKNVGFRIIKTTKQTNFPKGLYPVHIIACRIK